MVNDAVLVEALVRLLQGPPFNLKLDCKSPNIRTFFKQFSTASQGSLSDFTIITNRAKQIQKKIYSEVNRPYLGSLLEIWKKGVSLSGGKGKKKFDVLMNLAIEIYPLIIDIMCEPLVLGKIFAGRGKKGYKEFKDLKILSESPFFIEALKYGQEFAFQTEYLKRDNIIHQLRVFLLGCYIMQKDIDFWIKHFWGAIEKFFGSLASILPRRKEDRKRVIFAIWAMASLFHDYGRPIESFYKSLQGLYTTFEEIFFRFELKMPSTETKFLLSETWENKKHNFFLLAEYFLGGYTWFKGTQKLLKDIMDEADHGIVGAILCTHQYELSEMMQKLPRAYPMEPDEKESSEIIKEAHSLIKNESKINEIAWKTIISFYAAFAIAFHNLKEYWFITPLTQLLIFLDNLQEWDRLTKIGDQELPIFPCHSIKLEIQDVRNGGLQGKLIKAEVDYAYKKGNSGRHIFHRWDPMRLFKEYKKGLISKVCNGEIFDKTYKPSVGLHMVIKHNGKQIQEGPIFIDPFIKC